MSVFSDRLASIKRKHGTAKGDAGAGTPPAKVSPDPISRPAASRPKPVAATVTDEAEHLAIVLEVLGDLNPHASAKPPLPVTAPEAINTAPTNVGGIVALPPAAAAVSDAEIEIEWLKLSSLEQKRIGKAHFATFCKTIASHGIRGGVKPPSATESAVDRDYAALTPAERKLVGSKENYAAYRRGLDRFGGSPGATRISLTRGRLMAPIGAV